MNTDFYRLGRGQGQDPLYFQSLAKALLFVRKDGATTIIFAPKEPKNAKFTKEHPLSDLDMSRLHQLNQLTHQSKFALCFDKYSKKVGQIEALSFWRVSEEKVKTPTQEYVVRRAEG